MKQGKIHASPDNGEDIQRHSLFIKERLGSALRLVDKISEKQTPAPAKQARQITEFQIRSLLRLRRQRARFFEADLFADPAWDMLLELYAAELGQVRISITSLCGGAAVPATTAQRWIGHLESKQLISRSKDPLDGRRYFVSLTSKGLEAMENYFRTVPVGATLI